MKLLVNGTEREVEGGSLSVRELLDRLGGDYGHSAVAVNGGFIPRAEYGTAKVSEGDDVEIVAPFPGG